MVSDLDREMPSPTGPRWGLKGRTVAMLAYGLATSYPREHANLAQEIMERDTLVSDYPLGAEPRGDYFPQRNWIISDLSLETLVVKADVKSGALTTGRLTPEQNRQVFTVPDSVFSAQSRSTNAPIQDGAKLVLRVENVLEKLNPAMVPQRAEMKELIPAADTEASLFRYISKEPVHIDESYRQSGLAASTASNVLVMLELKGLVRQMGLTSYVLAREMQTTYRKD